MLLKLAKLFELIWSCEHTIIINTHVIEDPSLKRESETYVLKKMFNGYIAVMLFIHLDI